MIIKSVQLQNFKSHLNTKVDFQTGISIIMGDNGAGKSSILESISFALFKEYVSKTMDKLINNDKNKMQVTVEFIANGRTYKVVRKRKRNSSPESMLYVNDNDIFQLIEKGDAAVSDEIEKIIDLDKNLFLNAVYVKQGEIADLITQKPADKKEMMGRLLGVDDLENSWKNMKFIVKEYNNREIHLNGKISSFDTAQENLKNKEAERDKLKAMLIQMESELTSTEEKVNKIKTVKEFFDRKEMEFNKLNQAIEHYESTLKRLVKSKDELSEQIDEIIRKEEQIEEIKPRINKINVLENIKEKIIKLNELKNEKGHVEKSLKKIELFKHLISQNKEAHDNFINLEHHINELMDSRKEFEGSDTLETTINNNIKNLEYEAKKLQESVSKRFIEYGKIMEVDIQSIEELEKVLENKKEEISRALNQNEEQINGFNSKISDLNGQNKEIKKALKELEKAQDRCPVCESDLKESRREELINKYKNQIDKNNGNITSFRENWAIWNAEKEFLDKKKQNLQRINLDIIKRELNDIDKKNDEIKELNERIIQIKKSVQNLMEIDSNLNEKRKERETLKEAHNKYIGAQNSLKSIENPEKLEESFNNINNTIKPLEIEISDICTEIDVKKNQINEELQRLREIKEFFDKLYGEIQAKEKVLKKLTSVNEEINDTSNLIVSKKEELSQVTYEQEKHQKAKEDLDKCQKEFEGLQNKIGSLKGELKGVIQRISELQSDIESYKKDKAELGKISRFIELLNGIRQLYGKDGLQRDLRNRSRPLIENNTLDFFNKFNFEYSDIKLNEDYDITLFGPSGENSLDMISGGEIIAVAIALRLGIAKTLVKGNLELMILDEPTVHLDSYRRHELIDVIKKLSVIPQMIIVTHDPGLEEAATNILKIEKKNGVSQISTL